MPDYIIFNENLSLIEIDSTGIVLKEDIQKSIERVNQLSLSGINRVLVDTTKQIKLPSTFDVFEIFSMFPRGIKVALLVSKNQSTFGDINFAETVAMNRGISVRVFETREESLSWLGVDIKA